MDNPFAYSETSPIAGRPSGGTVRLKRVGVLSSGNFMGAAGLLGGLFGGCILFVISLAGLGNQDAAAGLVVGGGAIVLLPVIYGFFGFIGGLIYSVICNIVAGVTGGIEMEFGPN